jgi:hypothetical protein
MSRNKPAEGWTDAYTCIAYLLLAVGVVALLALVVVA